jgi:hypothetical protein
MRNRPLHLYVHRREMLETPRVAWQRVAAARVGYSPQVRRHPYPLVLLWAVPYVHTN